jgi:hypothetical protein
VRLRTLDLGCLCEEADNQATGPVRLCYTLKEIGTVQECELRGE